MLRSFDWIRLARTGQELWATLDRLPLLETIEDPPMAAPVSALCPPCARCGIHAPDPAKPGDTLCFFCRAVMDASIDRENQRRFLVAIWGIMSFLPSDLLASITRREPSTSRVYSPDGERFLAVVRSHWGLREWLEELLLLYGPSLSGLINIFPAIRYSNSLHMGEILCNVVEAAGRRCSADKFQIRFYPLVYSTIPGVRQWKTSDMTFPADDFVALLTMVSQFRRLLHPAEQATLWEIVKQRPGADSDFAWGRFLGMLNQEARDMIDAWAVRSWPSPRRKLFSALIQHVSFF